MTSQAARLRRTKAQRDSSQWAESSVRIVEGTGHLGQKRQPANYENFAKEFCGWVYAASTINADAVASLPLRLYVRQGVKNFKTRKPHRRQKSYLLGNENAKPGLTTHHKIMEFGDDFEEVTESHPVTDLLRDVNQFFNGYEMMKWLVYCLELYGNAYIHPVINKLGVPGELWPMPPQWMYIVPSTTDFIEGYVYGKSVEIQQRFEIDEVVHFRYIDAGTDPLMYGKGKVEAAWGTIQLDRSNQEMDMSFSVNHARPDYMIITKKVHGDALDRLESKVARELRGKGKTGQFLSIPGDIEIKPLNFPPKDLAGREDIIEKIAAVFGVPVSMLKANDPNLASAKAGYQQWREASVLPIARVVEQQLNQSLLPMFGLEDNAVLAFDNPVPADTQVELSTRSTSVSGGWMTPNEARADAGMDKIPDPKADRLYVNGQPLGATPGLAPLGLSAVPVAMAGQSPANTSAKDESPQMPVSVDPRSIKEAREIIREVAAGEIPPEAAGELLRAIGFDPDAASAMIDAAIPKVDDAGDDKPFGVVAAHETPSDEKQTTSTITDETQIDLSGAENAVSETFETQVGDITPSEPDGLEGVWEPCDDGSPGIINQIDRSWRRPEDQNQIDHLWGDAHHHKATPVDPDKVSVPEDGDSGDAEHTVREDEPSKLTSAIADVLESIFERARAIILDRVTQTRSHQPRKRKIAAADVDRITAELTELFAQSLPDELRGPIGDAVAEGGGVGMDALPADLDIDPFDISSEAASDFLDEYVPRLSGQIAETTLNRITDSLQSGVTDGLSNQEIADQIQDATGFSRSRAETIARTESATAYVEGERLAWETSGVVEGKEWLLAPNPCEFCAAVAKEFNNQPIDVRENFANLGDTIRGVNGGTMSVNFRAISGPPLHPNCRCGLAPVIAGA